MAIHKVCVIVWKKIIQCINSAMCNNTPLYFANFMDLRIYFLIFLDTVFNIILFGPIMIYMTALMILHNIDRYFVIPVMCFWTCIWIIIIYNKTKSHQVVHLIWKIKVRPIMFFIMWLMIIHNIIVYFVDSIMCIGLFIWMIYNAVFDKSHIYVLYQCRTWYIHLNVQQLN